MKSVLEDDWWKAWQLYATVWLSKAISELRKRLEETMLRKKNAASNKLFYWTKHETNLHKISYLYIYYP